jgi:hypothetical protein
MKHIRTVSALLLLIGAASSAMAADRTETVRFARGASSVTLTGTIRGYDGVKYALGASAGQVMSVLFKPSNASCYFNVFAPGSATAVFNGSTTGLNEYTANLAASGNYTVQVYLMRSAARRNESCRYSITVEISGRATQPRSSLRDDALVPGTRFNATGELPCARLAGQPMTGCKFGVVRSGRGTAQLSVFWPDGGNRVIFFENGRPASFDRSQVDGDVVMTVSRNADLFTVAIGAQRFEIPEAVITGG